MAGFGVSILQEGVSYNQTREIAQQAERLHYDSFWMSDHFFFTDRPYLECWSTLSSIATQTEKLRLGSLVLCNSYRHPSLLAKMAATLDVISQGRLELGVGAGWHKEEFQAYGIPYANHSARTGQLIEAVEMIKRLWSEESVTFEGKYYSLKNAISLPKPIQKPRPRIWIGGSSRRILRMAAENADGFNSSFPHFFVTPEEFAEKVRIADSYRSSNGRGSEGLQKSISLVVAAGENEGQVGEEFRKALNVLRRFGTRRETFQVIKRSPGKILSIIKGYIGLDLPRFMAAGTAETCTDIIKSYIDAGATYFQLLFPSAFIGDFRSMNIFAEDVIPRFRS